MVVVEGGTGKLFSEPYCPLQTTPDATERLPTSELLCCLFPASCEGSCVVLDTQGLKGVIKNFIFVFCNKEKVILKGQQFNCPKYADRLTLCCCSDLHFRSDFRCTEVHHCCTSVMLITLVVPTNFGFG